MGRRRSAGPGAGSAPATLEHCDLRKNPSEPHFLQTGCGFWTVVFRVWAPSHQPHGGTSHPCGIRNSGGAQRPVSTSPPGASDAGRVRAPRCRPPARAWRWDPRQQHPWAENRGVSGPSPVNQNLHFTGSPGSPVPINIGKAGSRSWVTPLQAVKLSAALGKATQPFLSLSVTTSGRREARPPVGQAQSGLRVL